MSSFKLRAGAEAPCPSSSPASSWRGPLRGQAAGCATEGATCSPTAVPLSSSPAQKRNQKPGTFAAFFGGLKGSDRYTCHR